jgi:hypothetical protein
MSDRSLYNLSRVLAVVLMIASAMIAAAANAPDTGLSKSTVAWLSVLQAGIGIALGVLPRAQGDGRPRIG